MRKNVLQANLLRIINGKFPNKSILVKKLMEILDIEREGVYRRLRGDASFTFAEVAIIAETFGISLDNLIGNNFSRSRPFSLIMVDYENPVEEDYEMCESYMRLLSALKEDPTCKCIETWNTIPFPMTYKYPGLTKFYVLRWVYQFKNYAPTKKYDEINIPERYFELMRENFEHNKGLAHTEYIFSSRIFMDLIDDIKHFYELGLLNKEHIANLHKEINEYLDYLNTLSLTGKFDETDTTFLLYISDIHIDQNQCYIESQFTNFCMIRILALGAISSVDGIQNEGLRNWLLGQKRLATLISSSGEKERITFFKRQRDYVESLADFC